MTAYLVWKHAIKVGLFVLVVAGGTTGRYGNLLNVEWTSEDVPDEDVSHISNVFNVAKHREKRGIMYPGTKWCGDGDVAKDYDDLGRSWRTDQCCRSHDYCPDTIPARGSKYGLINSTPYTRLHCDCDELFRECLKNVSNFVSSVVGSLYFDVSKPKCYRLEFPADCWDRDSKTELCLNYTFNKTQEKVWQYFDQPTWLPKKTHRDGVPHGTTAESPQEATKTSIPSAELVNTEEDPVTSSATLITAAGAMFIGIPIIVTLLVISKRNCASEYRYRKLSRKEIQIS